MQDFQDQARKNGIILLDHGPCQFCGADYKRGIYECMEHYNHGLHLLDFSNAEHHIARFLSVDAHALQHPEIHGRWSNHFHLARLHLMLKMNIKWDYKMSPLLSDYLNVYKSSRPDKILDVPAPLHRGGITAKDLDRAATSAECIEIINQWAMDVYQAWNANHYLISQLAEGFVINER